MSGRNSLGKGIQVFYLLFCLTNPISKLCGPPGMISTQEITINSYSIISMQSHGQKNLIPTKSPSFRVPVRESLAWFTSKRTLSLPSRLIYEKRATIKVLSFFSICSDASNARTQIWPSLFLTMLSVTTSSKRLYWVSILRTP